MAEEAVPRLTLPRQVTVTTPVVTPREARDSAASDLSERDPKLARRPSIRTGSIPLLDGSSRYCTKCHKPYALDESVAEAWWLCLNCIETMSHGSMDSAAEATWPPDAWCYTADCPEASKLTPYSRLREFTIGAKCFHTADHLDPREVSHECPQVDPIKCAMDFTGFESSHSESLGPDPKRLTFHTKVLILTEAITEVRVCTRMGTVSGMTFCKGEQALQAGCVLPALDKALPLDEDFPFLRKITMQQSITEDATKRILMKGIVYLRFETIQGAVLEVGMTRTPGTRGSTKDLPPEEVEGVLAIVALGLAHATPVSLQVVDLSAMEDPMEHLETVFYQRDLLSFINVTENMALYEHLGMVALEHADLLPVVDELLDGVENANPSSSELLPNVIATIDEALGNSNATMHSVFRLDRYLMNVIATKAEVGMWDEHWNHWKKLIPLKQMISVLAEMVLLTKRIALNKAEPNVYCYAFLSGQRTDYVKACLTFATQLLLITMLFLGIDLSQFGIFQQSFVISVTVTAIVMTIVKGQVENHLAFRKTFLDATLKNNIIVMDFLANVVMAGFVVLSNFLLLASTVEYLDLVLNATAIVFIIELDDAALNADDDGIADLYRGVCYKMVRDLIATKDPRYWNAQQLREEHPKVSLEHAALVWPDRKPREKKRRAKVHHHHKARSSVTVGRSGSVALPLSGTSTPARRPSFPGPPPPGRRTSDAPGSPTLDGSTRLASTVAAKLAAAAPSEPVVERRRLSTLELHTRDPGADPQYGTTWRVLRSGELQPIPGSPRFHHPTTTTVIGVSPAPSPRPAPLPPLTADGPRVLAAAVADKKDQ